MHSCLVHVHNSPYMDTSFSLESCAKLFTGSSLISKGLMFITKVPPFHNSFLQNFADLFPEWEGQAQTQLLEIERGYYKVIAALDPRMQDFLR